MSQFKAKGVALCGPSTAGKSFIAEKLKQRIEQTNKISCIAPAAHPLLSMYMDYMSLDELRWDELKSQHMNKELPHTFTQSIQLRADLEQYSTAIENTMGAITLVRLSTKFWKDLLAEESFLIVPDVRRNSEATFLNSQDIPVYEILNSNINKRTYQQYYRTPKTDSTSDLHKRIDQQRIFKTFANTDDDETVAEDIVDQIMFDITNK